jgi:hypothetical protein
MIWHRHLLGEPEIMHFDVLMQDTMKMIFNHEKAVKFFYHIIFDRLELPMG